MQLSQKNKIQAIRGMNDILPTETAQWRQLETALVSCMLQYGYQEIRFPIIEKTQLFKRSIGLVTDIVEKEMYSFTDLNGDNISLRPEGTAGCLRACLEHGLLHNQPQKLWYTGLMFRHEKPQKGRYRQFQQFGVEALGIPGVAIELELISMCLRLWHSLLLDKHICLQIHSLGDLNERQDYLSHLTSYFEKNLSTLDEDSKRRLKTNPLRILDSKNLTIQAMLQQAPKLLDFLGASSKQRFEDLCSGLQALNIPYTINPYLVRGLDYYGHLVFEWVTDKLGTQATVCAGGRYDTLVEQLGGEPTPAVGFALGLERLILLQTNLECRHQLSAPLTIFIMATTDIAMQQALHIAEILRNANNTWIVITNTLGGSFKSQFKKADKSEADLALIIGEDEAAANRVSIKQLRLEAPQITIAQQELVGYLQCQYT